jgi:hypothetical protein
MPRVLTVFLLLISTASFSQTYRRVTFGTGTGFAFSNVYGPLLFLEPAYHISDAWSVGARLEGGLVSLRNNLTLVGSYTVNGHYFFSQNTFRPFAGIGLGIYAVETGPEKCDCKTDASRNQFGAYPSIGFNYRHLLVKMEYNLVAGGHIMTTSIIPGSSGIPEAKFVKPDYLILKFGVLIGGGKRKGDFRRVK